MAKPALSDYAEIYDIEYRLIDTFKGLTEKPVILCIGSSDVVCDSLGPLTGHLLKTRENLNAYVYGTVSRPVTAKNVELSAKMIEALHPGTPVLAVDAAVGNEGCLGEIKPFSDGIYPGLATGKVLPKIGDYSIIGIVQEKSFFDSTVFASTRLDLIYEMAGKIARAISDYFAIKGFN